jgi:P27 family predicted phage terminase small subunit
MGMRGPLPKPPSLKLAMGNPGHRRIPKGVPVAPWGAVPECPAWLTDEAKGFWQENAPELARTGRLTLADGPAFSLLCQTWADCRAAEADVQKEGMTYRNKAGLVKRNPSVSIASMFASMVLTLLGHFGMTPASRARLNIEPLEPDAEPNLLAFARQKNEPEKLWTNGNPAKSRSGLAWQEKPAKQGE